MGRQELAETRMTGIAWKPGGGWAVLLSLREMLAEPVMVMAEGEMMEPERVRFLEMVMLPVV